jgi:predicted ferric reductase
MAAQWATNQIGEDRRRGEHVKARLEIPQSAERLTPEWLTAALHDTGTIKTSRVESFDTEMDIGNVLARIVGVIIAVLAGMIAFAWLPWYPVWAIMFIAVSVAVIWSLTAHGRDITEAYRPPPK